MMTPLASDSPADDDAPSAHPDGAIQAPAAVPAATPVDRGRFVLHMHDRDDDDSDADSNGEGNNDKEPAAGVAAEKSAPDSPKSFNSDEIFEDVEQVEVETTDQDLERLLGPLPRRINSGENNSENENATASLEVDDGSDESNRRKRTKRGACHCCPSSARRGPCRFFAPMPGGDDGDDSSAAVPRVGNMTILFPQCYRSFGFGIMGPHWFGPVSVVALLTIATLYFSPKAYHHIGPGSGIICLLFYVASLVSLCMVSCTDPGVVRSGGKPSAKNGYAGLPTANPDGGRGWRYCDLCSVYQPPDAVHCPECNVCVEGYDHHCPWMGTCIGKKNFQPFLAFNLTWLFYLLYAIFWVSIIGATFFDPAHSPYDHGDSSGSGD